MNKWLTNAIINNIKKKQSLSPRDERICRYTLEGLISSISKTILIICVSIILGLFFETILLMIFYGLLRSFAFGIHASRDLYCWIFSIITYLLIPYLISILIIPSLVYYLTFIVFGFLLILYSPSDTPKRPLIHKEKRKRNKIITIVTCVIYLSISLLFKNYIIDNSILFAICIQSICVNPLIYKLFNTNYNNYLSYMPKTV